MTIKAILFDLDNTLYDYDSVNIKALRATHRVFKKYVNITFEKFTGLLARARDEIKSELVGTASSHNRVIYFQRMIEYTHKTVEPGIILELYKAYWDYMFKHMRLKSGSLSVLKAISKKGMKIGLLTDQTASIQLGKVEALGISKYIDMMVTSEESGRDKPHSSMFLLMLHKFGVLPEEAIMIGDNPEKDIQGAAMVGIPTIHVRWGDFSKAKSKKFIKADYSTNDIRDVPGLIEKLENK